VVVVEKKVVVTTIFPNINKLLLIPLSLKHCVTDFGTKYKKEIDITLHNKI